MASRLAVPGLEGLLDSIGLGDRSVQARAWCEKMGACFLEELAEDEVLEQFSEEIQLKPLEKRRLRKALCLVGTAPAAEPISAQSSLGCGESKIASKPPIQMPPRSSVFVKNTFLDLDDGEQSRASQLRRLSTEPPPEVLRESDEDEDEEDTEDLRGPSSSDVGLTGDTTPTKPWLYKTMTCDGYEPIDQWAWAEGDPNGYALSHSFLGAGTEGSTSSSTMPRHDDDTSAEFASGVLTEGYGGCGSQVVGVVMVPADLLPSFAMGPFVPGPCFPGCVAVPMERFSRWPCEPWQPAAPAPERDAKKNVLQRAFSVSSSIFRLRWTVDARKLKSKDTEAVSPPFGLADEGSAGFKMILRPRVTSDLKGGASFKKARGRGIVEMRCLDSGSSSDNPTLVFRISIGSPSDESKQQPPRGPVRHDFAEHSIGGLPRGQDEWNFSQVVDKSTLTFVVCLEVLNGRLTE